MFSVVKTDIFQTKILKIGLFPLNQEEVLQKTGIKNSSKSFIDFSESDTNTIKISGRCITQEDVPE